MHFANPLRSVVFAAAICIASGFCIATGFSALANDGSSSEITDHIDTALQDRWSALGLSTAERCTDEKFVRRLYLDLVGRIPTLDERQTFLFDGRANKRQELIDQLLAAEDHVQHMADTFDTLLMGRTKARKYEERAQHQWRSWLENVFRENRPWNTVVAEALRARPQSAEERGAVWYLYERNDNHQAIAEAVAANFFGIRIDCAQCHDHMLADEIEQQHYWGLVAFFNRSKNQMTEQGPRVLESAIGGFSEFANLEGSSSPNLLTFYSAKTIDEPRPGKDAKQEDSDDLYYASTIAGEPRVPKFSRREMLVDQVVRDNPLIARALVNRIWAMLLGRGIVHPFDQMDSVHPPSHPELLDWLASDFQSHGYDTRRLIRAIVQTQAYQLDSQQPHGVEDPATFAWYLERPLTAEQLARSFQIALRGHFRNDHPLLTQLREKIPEVMPETVVTPVAESLFLSNNAALHQFLLDSASDQLSVLQVNESSDTQVLCQRLFQCILGREPDDEELGALVQFLQPTETATDHDPLPLRIQHASWALLMSAEFRFNH